MSVHIGRIGACTRKVRHAMRACWAQAAGDGADVDRVHTRDLSDAERVWRVRPAGRVAGVAIACLWLMLAITFTVSTTAAGVAPLAWISAGAIALGTWRAAFAPYVALGPSGVTIQNPLMRTTVPYAEIANVRAGYSGLTIVGHRGRQVTSWAVQKSNGARWLHNSTRADMVAAAILAKKQASTAA